MFHLLRLLSYYQKISSDIVGELLGANQLYDVVNVILSLQVGGFNLLDFLIVLKTSDSCVDNVSIKHNNNHKISKYIAE